MNTSRVIWGLALSSFSPFAAFVLCLAGSSCSALGREAWLSPTSSHFPQQLRSACSSRVAPLPSSGVQAPVSNPAKLSCSLEIVWRECERLQARKGTTVFSVCSVAMQTKTTYANAGSTLSSCVSCDNEPVCQEREVWEFNRLSQL